MSTSREAFEKWRHNIDPYAGFEGSVRDGFTAGYAQGRADLLAEIKAECFVAYITPNGFLSTSQTSLRFVEKVA